MFQKKSYIFELKSAASVVVLVWFTDHPDRDLSEECGGMRTGTTVKGFPNVDSRPRRSFH